MKSTTQLLEIRYNKQYNEKKTNSRQWIQLSYSGERNVSFVNFEVRFHRSKCLINTLSAHKYIDKMFVRSNRLRRQHKNVSNRPYTLTIWFSLISLSGGSLFVRLQQPKEVNFICKRQFYYFIQNNNND